MTVAQEYLLLVRYRRSVSRDTFSSSETKVCTRNKRSLTAPSAAEQHRSCVSGFIGINLPTGGTGGLLWQGSSHSVVADSTHKRPNMMSFLFAWIGTRDPHQSRKVLVPPFLEANHSVKLTLATIIGFVDQQLQHPRAERALVYPSNECRMCCCICCRLCGVWNRVCDGTLLEAYDQAFESMIVRGSAEMMQPASDEVAPPSSRTNLFSTPFHFVRCSIACAPQ